MSSVGALGPTLQAPPPLDYLFAGSASLAEQLDSEYGHSTLVWYNVPHDNACGCAETLPKRQIGVASNIASDVAFILLQSLSSPYCEMDATSSAR